MPIIFLVFLGGGGYFGFSFGGGGGGADFFVVGPRFRGRPWENPLKQGLLDTTPLKFRG